MRQTAAAPKSSGTQKGKSARPARKASAGSVHDAWLHRGGGPGASDMVKQVMQGLPFDELQKLQRGLGVPLDQLSQRLGIGRATLHRRKSSGRLTTDESDKVMRFTRLLAKAARVFGNPDAARQWLLAPQRAFGGAKPLDYASTEVGALEVDKLLGRIEYGVYS